MNFGACPYDDCDQPLEMVALPEDRPLPTFLRDTCPHCKRVVWRYLSRVDPKAYTQDGFDEEWKRDEATKVIKPR